ARTDGGDERGEFRIDRRGRLLLGNLVAEFGALIDPRAKDADVVRRQGTARRHLHPAVAVDQTAYQLAVRAVAWNDDRPVVTAPEGVLPKIEPEPGLLHFGPVTAVAILREQRFHVGLIIDAPGGRGGKLWLRCDRDKGQRRDDHPEQHIDLHRVLRVIVEIYTASFGWAPFADPLPHGS